ncbi:MAG: hypothetical protein QOI78_816 [Actinomycetota bacterium]|nr:hypothetical protein [Actinomycetota bacterium]
MFTYDRTTEAGRARDTRGPAPERGPECALARVLGNRAVAGLLRSVPGGGFAEGAGPLDAATEAAIDAERAGGSPLPAGIRADMEQQFGVDLSAVRLHTGPRAETLSRDVGAEAFTTGTDVFFGAGRPDPAGPRGRELLGHELTHVVQQAAGTAGTAGRVSHPGEPAEVEARAVARAVAAAPVRTAEPSASGKSALPGTAGARRPAVQRDVLGDRLTEETGIKVVPDPPRPGVVGSTIPLPTGVTVLKPPGGGRGSRLTAPSFLVRLDPRGLVAGLLDQVSLGGLPLTEPTFTYHAAGNTFAADGTVSIPSDYPGRKTPTDIRVSIRSSALNRFDVQGGTGPFVADLTLDVGYDKAQLQRLWAAVRTGDLGAAAGKLGDLDRPAHAAVSGVVGVGTAGHHLPLTYLRGSGSVDPAGARASGGAAGVIGLPPGTFRPDLAVPALGAVYGGVSAERGGGVSGGYAFGGITGTPSIKNLVTGDLAGAFAPFAYAQVTAARQTADGHRFGLRISAQYQLGSGAAAQSPLAQFRGGLDARRQAERYAGRADGDPKTADIDPAVRSQWTGDEPSGAGAGLSAVVTGTFDLFGGQ